MELKEILKLDEVKESVVMGHVINYIADTNEGKYNLTKAAEELIELADVLLKTANKQPNFQPPMQDIVDELGDVYIRLSMIMRSLGIDQTEVHDRKIQKVNKYVKYMQEEKYNRGI